MATTYQYEYDLRFLEAFDAFSYPNYGIIDPSNNIYGLDTISSIIASNLGASAFGNYVSDFNTYVVNQGYTWVKINPDNTTSSLTDTAVNNMLTMISGKIVLGA